MSIDERREKLKDLCNRFAATYMIIKPITYEEQQAPILKEIEDLFNGSN